MTKVSNESLGSCVGVTHRVTTCPRHYRGGDSAPLFGNFLEPLSKTPWWIVPTLWIPPVIAGTVYGSSVLGVAPGVGYFVFGLCFWTLLEYILHRFLFHLDQ